MSKSMHLNYLSEGIKDRNLRITVVGMGYVGLPSAISFHEAGFPVWGLDNSEEALMQTNEVCYLETKAIKTNML